MSSLAETELLARCRQGDAEAWNVLFDRHYQAAGRFVFQLGHDFTAEDVEEICQEAFLTVVRNLHSFQGNSQFQTWLFRIAANKARDHRTRRRAAKRGSGLVPIPLDTAPREEDGPYTVNPPSPAPGPDLALIQAENIALVGQAMEQMGGPCQELIELRYYADLSYEEISTSLTLHPKTVSSRLSRCLDKLQAIAVRLLAEEKRGHKAPTSV